MEAFILDSSFNTLGLIDVFESFIWTDRYLGYGDFEIYMSIASGIDEYIQQGNYVYINSSEHLMFIEELAIDTDPEKGAFLKVTGRSVEAYLERRIIWGRKTISGNLQDSIRMLLEENIISPENTHRKIPNIEFQASVDPFVTELSIDFQLDGDNLYDVIIALCSVYNLGFKLVPVGSGLFIFELYKGVDRSYNQSANNYVVFSPKFENLLTTNYYETKKALVNSALVVGEGEGEARIMVDAFSDEEEASGLDRREILIKSSSRSKLDDGTILGPEVYKKILVEDGIAELAEYVEVISFEGEIEAKIQFLYGVDFFVGDIVQLINEYGMEATVRVSELILAHDPEGESYIPTFIST